MSTPKHSASPLNAIKKKVTKEKGYKRVEGKTAARAGLQEEADLFTVDDTFDAEMVLMETANAHDTASFAIDEEDDDAITERLPLESPAAANRTEAKRPIGVYDYRKSRFSLHNARTVLKNTHLPWRRKKKKKEDGPPDPNASLSNKKRAFANIIKAYVGSGIMGLPYAFAQGGMFTAIISLLLIGLISTYCVHMLIESKRMLSGANAQTFSDVGEATFGRPGRLIVVAALGLSQLGFCVAYLIFIGENIHDIYRAAGGGGGEGVWTWVLLCMPPLIGLCLLRSLKRLAPFSMISNVLILTSVFIVMIQSGSYEHPPDHPRGELHQFNAKGFPLFFGMATYTFEGIGLAVPVEASLREAGAFSRLWNTALFLLTLLFTIFGGVGYSVYGNSVAPIITQMMPPTALSVIVKLALCVALLFTFPIMLHPVLHMLEGHWNPLLREEDNVDGLTGTFLSITNKRRILRACAVLSLGCVAVYVPNFALVLSFIGSLPCNLLAFILPTLFHLKLNWHIMTFHRRVISLAVLAFGVSAMVICTTVTLFADDSLPV